MKSSAKALHRPADLGLLGLALVLALSLMLLVAAPQAQAAKVSLDETRTTLTTDPGTTSALLGAGIIPLPMTFGTALPDTVKLGAANVLARVAH